MAAHFIGCSNSTRPMFQPLVDESSSKKVEHAGATVGCVVIDAASGGEVLSGSSELESAWTGLKFTDICENCWFGLFFRKNESLNVNAML